MANDEYPKTGQTGAQYSGLLPHKGWPGRNYKFFRHRIVPGMPGATYEVIAFILLWVAAALTVYTGVIYFRNGMAHIDTNPKGRA